MIRLDAISIIDLPQRNKADIPGRYAMRINCVLHSGPLPQHQELEVRINGVFQTGVREGDQHVFSWQLLQAADRVQISLRSGGVLIKHWQGFWNEQDAIIHAGTLPAQIFFDGKAQPPAEGTLALILSASANGNQQLAPSREALGADLSVIAVAQTASAISQAWGATRRPQDQQRATEGETLTDAQEEKEGQREEEGYGDDEPGSDEEDDEDRWEYELERDEEDDDGDQWKDEDEEDQGKVDEMMADEDEMDGDTTQLLASREASVTGEPVHRETQQPLTHVSLSTTWQVATVHANPLAQAQTLATLQELLALRPKTLLVDVRPQSPQKKKYHHQDQLSKQSLRSVFGAKYWDRGWAISCTSQMVPRYGKIRGISWRYVVNKPESHPDGIPSLAQKLAEGYALVVIDSLATYAESRRRAVVEELQRRVADLALGPLG